MSSNKEYDIKIVVTDITVDEYSWYISYEIYVNGELKESGGCCGDHCWQENYQSFKESIIRNPLPYIMESMDGCW